MVKYYVASKSKHGKIWISWRDKGINIVSRWIDKYDQGRFPSEYQTEHWDNILEDIKSSDVLILYSEAGEIQKGALAELGMAMALNKKIYYVGSKNDKKCTALEHASIQIFDNLEQIFNG